MRNGFKIINLVSEEDLEIEKMLKRYKIDEIESELNPKSNYMFDFYYIENDDNLIQENEDIEKNKYIF